MNNILTTLRTSSKWLLAWITELSLYGERLRSAQMAWKAKTLSLSDYQGGIASAVMTWSCLNLRFRSKRLLKTLIKKYCEQSLRTANKTILHFFRKTKLYLEATVNKVQKAMAGSGCLQHPHVITDPVKKV